jgi:hypothetical protein
MKGCQMMFGGVECYYCGRIKPLEEVRARTIEVESGRSGGSMTFRGSRSGYSNSKNTTGRRNTGGMSYNTGRTYYKKVKVYICDECLKKEILRNKMKAEEDEKFIINVLVAVVVFSAIYFSYNFLKGLL